MKNPILWVQLFCIQESEYCSSTPLLVIDGQQRLTTMILLLVALYNNIDGDNKVGDFSRAIIKDEYLIKPHREGDEKYKLLLTKVDKDSLIELMEKDDVEVSSLESIRIKENYNFFKEKLKNKDALEIICKGILKLQIVSITLNQEDNPQLIFESMNSAGKELTQADLIRNYVLMGLKQEKQTKLYKDYWHEMELYFGQENYQKYFNDFIRHYLTLKTRNIPNKNKVYDAFKKYHKGLQVDIEQLVSDIKTYAKYFCNMALEQEKDKILCRLFMNLKELKVDVVYPLLLELYNDYYKNSILSKSDFELILQLLESYIFRRAICDLPTNALNKIFTYFAKGIDKDKYLEGIKAKFVILDSSRRFPKDEEFKDSLVIKDIYGKKYLFRKLENFERKEEVLIKEYQFEHIMPQKLSKEWQESLGDNYKKIHEKYLHTLGNLTLTGYNPEYSNKSFREKRDMEGGFAQSPLRLNAELKDVDEWNEESIKNRAKNLADKAVEIWAYPTLSDDIVSKYKTEKNKPNYTIESYKYSDCGNNKYIFEQLKNKIFALDSNSNITENCLKHYISYKLNTHFIEIKPLAKGLKLSLNININDIDDPRKICRNVANVGTCCNGDTEVTLDSIDDIDYCIGLIRQAFEKQF